MIAISVAPLALTLPGGGAVTLSARIVSRTARTAAENARRALHAAKSAPPDDLLALVERIHNEHGLVAHLIAELDARIAEVGEARSVLVDEQATLATATPLSAAAQQVRGAVDTLRAAQPDAAFDAADDARDAVEELLAALTRDREVAGGLLGKLDGRRRDLTVRALARGCQAALRFPATPDLTELTGPAASPDEAVAAARLVVGDRDEHRRRAAERRRAALRADALTEVADTWSRADA